jgi:hypothetical protein
LEASNLPLRTIRACTDDGASFAAFLTRQGMATAVASVRRQHAEALIATESPRPGTARSSSFLRW